MYFIDLFAGLGGFHMGLRKLGFECVFACEINPTLRSLYEKNFEMAASGDIKQIDLKDVPQHDILCAGFPCQPFSKAGPQIGFEDLNRGTLFYEIARILDGRRPSYLILENVPNMEFHDKGRTWSTIKTCLGGLGYDVDHRKLSPHQFEIPQHRERMFIVGAQMGLEHFQWPEQQNVSNLRIESVLDKDPGADSQLPEREVKCLELWQQILNTLPKSAKIPSFPIWTMEFGADYPIEGPTPFHMHTEDLANHKGAFGQPLSNLAKTDQLCMLPKYAVGTNEIKFFPPWKRRFIRQNREFYQKFQEQLDPFLPELMSLPPSWQKFEWNCQGEPRNIWKNLIQFRPSGIRIKRPNYAPSLVASNTTQIPIIGWEKRYLTVQEGARLQSLDGLELPSIESGAYRALGNAVNARIIAQIAENLILSHAFSEGKNSRVGSSQGFSGNIAVR